jgi:nitric oxide synthase oxygenase domain/subunit
LNPFDFARSHTRWNNLQVRDKRHVNHPDAIFDEVLEHMKMATAGVNMAAIMTIFPPKRSTELWGLRFWGDQIVRYVASPPFVNSDSVPLCSIMLHYVLLDSLVYVAPPPFVTAA